MQSPVDVLALPSVVTPADHVPEKLFYRYEFKETPAVFFNDGRSLAVTFQEHVGGIALGTKFPNKVDSTWALWQLAVHAPSEHLFKGRRVELELQLYHTLWNPEAADPLDPNHIAPEHTQAVLALGFEEGSVDPSAFLDALAAGNPGQGLPSSVNAEGAVNTDAPLGLDFSSLLKAADQDPTKPVSVLSYNGSLTTPPCTANARWFVRDDPLPAHLATIEKFVAAIQAVTGPSGNPRAIQPPGARVSQVYLTVDATNLPTEEQSLATLVDPSATPTTQIQSHAGEDATMPVQNHTDPAGAEISHERAGCPPSSAACILAHYEPDQIKDNPDVILDSNAALAQAKEDVMTATHNLTGALQKHGEVCGDRDKMFADFQTMQPGPERNVLNQNLAVANTLCDVEIEKVENQKDTVAAMENHEGAIRGALGKAIQDAQVELNQTMALPEDLEERHGAIAPQGALACHAEERLWNPFSQNSGDTTVTIDQAHNNGSPHRAVGQPGVVAGCAFSLAQKEATHKRRGGTRSGAGALGSDRRVVADAAAGFQEKKALKKAASTRPREEVGIRRHAVDTAGGAAPPPAKPKESLAKKWI